jgi:hypothetical protein
VTFEGSVTISGTYSSDEDGLFGKYVTLSLSEASRVKIPALSEDDTRLVLDPALSGNEKVLEIFGDTGSSGTFEISVSKVTATNQEESFGRTAILGQIVDLV